jgi:hypothetical protein
MRRIYIAPPLIALIIYSCSVEESDGSNPSSLNKNSRQQTFSLSDQQASEMKPSADISNVEGIAGVPLAETGSGDSLAGMDIYMWDASGDRKVLELTKKPVHGVIADIFYTKNHIFFALSYHAIGLIKQGSNSCSVIVLTRQTGVLHCLANIQISKRIQEWAKKPVIQTDSSGDRMVFIGMSGSGGGYEDLFRLDMTTGVANLVMLYANPTAYPEDYAINDDGDVLHKEVLTGVNGSRNFMVTKANGTTSTIGASNAAGWAYCITNGVQNRVNDFYAVRGTGSGAGNTLVKFIKDGSGNYNMTQVIGDVQQLSSFQCQYVLKNGSQLFFLGRKNGQGYLLAYEDRPDGEADVWSTHVIPDMIEINHATGDSASIYISGEDKLSSGTIKSMNLTDYQFNTLIPHHQFVFSDFQGPFGGYLVFTAERMADSAFVKGRINITNGSVTPVTINLPAVRQLVPLN